MNIYLDVDEFALKFTESPMCLYIAWQRLSSSQAVNQIELEWSEAMNVVFRLISIIKGQAKKIWIRMSIKTNSEQMLYLLLIRTHVWSQKFQ